MGPYEYDVVPKLVVTSMKTSVQHAGQHAAMPSITDFHTTNTDLDGFDGLAPAKRTNKQLQTERSAKNKNPHLF